MSSGWLVLHVQEVSADCNFKVVLEKDGRQIIRYFYHRSIKVGDIVRVANDE